MYDDETMRMAAELSLMEDMDFNPCNLEEAKRKIKQLEQLVDEHILADQIDTSPKALDSDPISTAQIREIFAVTEVRLASKNSAPQRGLSNDSAFRDSSDSIFSALSHGPPDLSLQDPWTMGSRSEGNSQKDTITSITWKLKWYQKKLTEQIQQTQEV